MKKNKFRSALNQELKHVRVDEKLKRRIIAAAEEEKRRRQRKTMLRAISGLAAALVVMLGVTGILLARRPDVPDIQNQPLSQGQGTYTPAPKSNSAEAPAATAEPAVVCIEDPGITPEPTAAPIMVWATEGGKYYHAEENCSGMEDAFSVDLLTAAFEGKQPCQVCNPPAYDAEYDGSGMVFSFEREESEAAAGESNLQLAARHYEGENGDVILLGGDYEYDYEYVANLADSASPDWIETPVVRENFNAYALETLSGRLEKQHIHDWFRYQIDDPEMGILWDEVNMSAKGVDTQIAGVGNPVASGTEYRFVDMNDPGYKIALYELNEAYNPSEMEVNLLTHKVGRYYDGENMGEYEHPVVFTLTGGNDAGNGIKDYYLRPSDIIDGINRQTVAVSPVSSGKASIFEDTLEAGGARIHIKILRMEDCMAIMLQPEEDSALAENTGIVSAGFEALQPYMEMDPVWHPGWMGWLFQGELPEGGDKLVVSLENGEIREFDFGTLI